jgi:hypothetical protein
MKCPLKTKREFTTERREASPFCGEQTAAGGENQKKSSKALVAAPSLGSAIGSCLLHLAKGWFEMANTMLLAGQTQLPSNPNPIGVALAPLFARCLAREARDLEAGGVVVIALDGDGLPRAAQLKQHTQSGLRIGSTKGVSRWKHKSITCSSPKLNYHEYSNAQERPLRKVKLSVAAIYQILYAWRQLDVLKCSLKISYYQMAEGPSLIHYPCALNEVNVDLLANTRPSIYLFRSF